MSDPSDPTTILDFNRWYYDADVWGDTYYMGVKVWKSVADLWSYQEIIFETEPDCIIETGTAFGGSALWMAHCLDRVAGMALGRVVTIDINLEHVLSAHRLHSSIFGVTGDSTSPATLRGVLEYTKGRRVMVTLDSNHSKDHVLRELELYAPLVSSGCYLIVEDTNVNGHPVLLSHGPGPAEALAEWLPQHQEFEVDPHRTRFGLTFQPGGYLLRK